MSVIRVGSTSSYADGWEQIFGGATGHGPRAKKPSAAKRAGKKSVARTKPAAGKAKRRAARGVKKTRR